MSCATKCFQHLNSHGALIFRVKQSKLLDTCPITNENTPFFDKTMQQFQPPATSTTTLENATIKFWYSVQCNVLSHSRTAVVMTKTACIHWELTCISLFFLWQFNFPYLTECDQAPGHDFIKIICKSLNLYTVLQTNAFCSPTLLRFFFLLHMLVLQVYNLNIHMHF